MKKLLLSSVAFVLALSACTNKQAGFALEDSPIRYVHKTFADKEVLAEVNGQKYMKGQILDKSPVLKDLANQENEARIGLVYLKVRDMQTGKASGTIEMYMPEPKATLGQILNRFGQTPTAGLNVSYRKPVDEDVIAQFHDTKISPDEIDGDHAVLQAIEQRRYREIASQFNGQITRILLSEDAAKKKIDLQSYLKKNVFGGHDVTVSTSELNDYLKTIGFAQSELNEELRPRFLDAIKQHKEQALMEEYVASEILKKPIEVSFEQPQERLKLGDSWKPVMGYSDAPIALVAFSGATCNDCGKFINDLYAVMKKYDGYLKLNWIHSFNKNDGVARMMAKASLCVDAVHPGKSLAFMDAFADKSGQVDEKAFYTWADHNHVNSAALKKCFVEATNDPLLAQHIDYGRRIGIVANPTLVVEGQTLQGVISKEQLDMIVRENIRAKDASWLRAEWRHLTHIFGG